MSNIRDLLNRMADEEEDFARTEFLAPCLTGGRVRARIGGMVQTLKPDPSDFSGWGIFKMREGHALLVEEADLPLIARYLASFPLLRLLLCRPLREQTWLAYPANEGDMRQRFSIVRPVAVHLVTEGTRFDQVMAHTVGGSWWFAEVDRRADPAHGELLRAAFRDTMAPSAVAFSGRTPEMRTAYDLATQADPRFARFRQAQAVHAYETDQVTGELYYPHSGARETREERRLRQALAIGGGHLRDFQDRGEYFLVEWTTTDGQYHTSAVSRQDLTVISSGICLSGRDRDFDLQSLVGVIERREW